MKKTVKPRKFLVLVEFEDFYKPLSYFNDEFELEVGDLVYVDGKLEGKRGRIIDITYNFHIKSFLLVFLTLRFCSTNTVYQLSTYISTISL
jgi:hypothetical protein